jgi:hypothetical protein
MYGYGFWWLEGGVEVSIRYLYNYGNHVSHMYPTCLDWKSRHLICVYGTGCAKLR